jgi:hypothetical protein
MKPTRRTSRRMAVERIFAPGRLRHQWGAAAYERLVPLCRIARGQEGKDHRNRIQEEQRCAL